MYSHFTQFQQITTSSKNITTKELDLSVEVMDFLSLLFQFIEGVIFYQGLDKTTLDETTSYIGNCLYLIIIYKNIVFSWGFFYDCLSFSYKLRSFF